MTSIQLSKRKSIQALEDVLVKHEQRELDLFHHFCHGVYMRELHIPKDTILTGRIHKFPCLNVVMCGKIKVATEEGDKMIEGPCVFKAPAGVKRAGYTITDTIWMTVHGYPDEVERSDDEMIALYTADSHEMLENK